MRNKDFAVLVHGLGGSRLDMWPIARRLNRLGFRVKNWGYRSIGNGIETHADRLAKELLTIDKDLHESKFHLVTHSMGGIIARNLFANARFENLGRVVMLAPPHRGSHAARQLAPFIGWLSPSLKQLSDDSDSYVNSLANSLKQNEIEFGIVEAVKDRVIASGSVNLDGHRDFARVDGHHGVLTWYRETIQLVENFLIRGSFSFVESEPEDYPRQTSAECLTLEGGS